MRKFTPKTLFAMVAALAVLMAIAMATAMWESVGEWHGQGFDSRAASKDTQVAYSLGLPELELPNGVGMSAAQVALGRKLFFDRRLSTNGTMSCAMCHVPEQAFASNDTQVSVGMHGRSLLRNAPSLLNVGWMKLLFHDGRSDSLVDLAWMPLVHPDEMGNASVQAVLDRIATLDDYADPAKSAYGRSQLDANHVALALAAFQYTLVSAESRFDRWRYGGEVDGLSKTEIEGFRIFTGKGGCSSCHHITERSAMFTDFKFHVTGIAADRPTSHILQIALAPGMSTVFDQRDVASLIDPPIVDYGRFSISKVEAERFAFRTPSLRNIALTAPYMHDGSVSTLDDVVSYYERGGGDVVNKSPLIRRLALTKYDKVALVAFLKSLSGTRPISSK